jgi:phosphoglycolate phosphatase-like HAD superfamily hydrolase
MPILRVEDGADKGKSVPLTMRKTVSIGRDTGADVSLRDAKSSRFHARVEFRNDGVWLIDLNSKNGTFINGIAVKEHRLKLGDHFMIGDTVFALAPDPKPVPRAMPGSTAVRTPKPTPGPAAGAETAASVRGDSIARRLQSFYKLRAEKQKGAEAPEGPKRFIVFEIDGTLVQTDGMVEEAFNQAIEEVYGVPNALADCPMSGRSEREVVQVALRAAKVPEEKIKQFLARVMARYVDILVGILRKRPRGTILPGVRDLLERLDKDSRWAVGLLTRHLLLSARPILGLHGLWDFFKYGAFADDHESRNALPGLLLDRARDASGLPIQAQDVYAVADTVRDLACAKSAGMRTIAVATGGSNFDALGVLNPYMLFPSFEDVDEVLQKLNVGLT